MMTDKTMVLVGSENWSKETFEDSVARGIIACFESKIVRLERRGNQTARLRPKDLKRLRAIGPYFPSRDRIYDATANDKGWMHFDIQNDTLPKHACLASRGLDNSGYAKLKEHYIYITHMEKVDTLPKLFHRQSAGQLYRYMRIWGLPNGICGEYDYISVEPNTGLCVPCEVKIIRGGSRNDIGKQGFVLRRSEIDPDTERGLSINTSMTLQAQADKRFQWAIRAREDIAKATLGCTKEEVKSLLYARSLPMTSTGRKRPILHLVEAHQRRLKNGTDVDVTSFLRGTQTVVIGGTEFKVKPPVTKLPELSSNSHRYYK